MHAANRLLLLGLLAAPAEVACLTVGVCAALHGHGRVLQPARAQAQDADSGECHSLGDDPGMLCSDGACIESKIYLCSSPPEDGSAKCTLQEGLSLGDGKPVWACAHDEGMQPRGQPQDNDVKGASR